MKLTSLSNEISDHIKVQEVAILVPNLEKNQIKMHLSLMIVYFQF